MADLDSAVAQYTEWVKLNDSSPYLERMAHLKHSLATVETLHYRHTGGRRPHTEATQRLLKLLRDGKRVLVNSTTANRLSAIPAIVAECCTTLIEGRHAPGGRVVFDAAAYDVNRYVHCTDNPLTGVVVFYSKDS